MLDGVKAAAIGARLLLVKGADLHAYAISIIGLALVCLIPLVLASVVGPLKDKAGLGSGPVVGQGDESLAFRADRAHMNNLESLTPFAVPAILAMAVGVWPAMLGVLVWLFVLARIGHALIYLRGGAAARGGNLRSALFGLGALATIGVIGATIIAAF